MIFDKIITHPAVHLGAHVGYFSGLTTLLPIFGRAWERNIAPWVVSPTGFYIGLGLIGLSILLLARITKTSFKLLRVLGWTMIIPGVLAIVFSLFGETSFWTFMQDKITGFSFIEPGARWLVHHSVPNAAFMGAAYIFVGMFLIWLGRKIENLTTYF